MDVPSQEVDFQRHMSWYLFLLSEPRWEIVVGFVDIVEHHCIDFLFIIQQLIYMKWMRISIAKVCTANTFQNKLSSSRLF